jgi:hypothetical protein
MGVLALNLLSSPGAGKTALIERMARDLTTLDPLRFGSAPPTPNFGGAKSIVYGEFAID